MTLVPGTHIRYMMDNLGLIGTPGVVSAGEEGTVIGPAPDGSGWIYTEPDKHPKTVCPVASAMLEVVK